MQFWTLHFQELNSSNEPHDTFNQWQEKITQVDVSSNRWSNRLILVQVFINYRYKWGTDVVLVLTRAFQLSTDTNTVDWWYSSVRPVRGPVAHKFTSSTQIYGQHVDLRVARKSTTSPLPGKRGHWSLHCMGCQFPINLFPSCRRPSGVELTMIYFFDP